MEQTKSRNIFTFTEEPKGELYSGLLAFALDSCSYFQLVLRHGWSLSAHGQSALNRLLPYKVAEERVSEWPGTILHGHTAQLLKFRFDGQSARALADLANGFYDWVYPDLPEDLSLMRMDDVPWLVTIAHEKDSYLYLSDDEFGELTSFNPRYRLMLVKNLTSPG